jgi:hypothetical protein
MSCLEDWENVHFDFKGDHVNGAITSAKFRGLMFLVEDDDNIGELKEIDCAVPKSATKRLRQRRVVLVRVISMVFWMSLKVLMRN